MQEDKDLKILLQENAIQETSSLFDNDVMQRIKIAAPTRSAPLINGFILKSLIVVFLAAFLSVIICLLFVPVNNLPINFSFHVNNSIYNQLFSFIITFWIIMLLNILWNKWQTYRGLIKSNI